MSAAHPALPRPRASRTQAPSLSRSLSLSSWLALASSSWATTACDAPASPASCPLPQTAEESSVPEQVVTDLRALRGARVFFLHHSVGRNILDAVARLDAAVEGAPWPVVDVATASARDGGLLAELLGGRNAAPMTKIDAFVTTLLGHPGLRADVALMKFCYVDFDPDTDVDALFAYYRDSLRAVRQLRPGLRLAHMTVPLKARPDDLRARVRRVLGMRVWEDAANARRAAFNARLRTEFAGEPVFDIAAIEARGPVPEGPSPNPPEAGAATEAETTSTSTPSLDPRFTDDGGHLNPTGARVVAVAWLRFLADTVRAGGAEGR